MKYIIPTSHNETYKGWKVLIVKASEWNKKLSVTITPAIQINSQSVLSQPKEMLMKAMLDLNAITDKHKHTFTVDPIYFLILPMGEAIRQARKYIDDKLGRFDINNFNR